MSRRPYSYTVLRYIHDIVTGEFVNVGLVFVAPRAGAEPPIVLFEFKERIQRLRPMFPDINRHAFVSSISAVRSGARKIAKQFANDQMFSEADARIVATKMLPHDGSSLQWSEIGTGISKDIQKDFSRISNRMLSSYDRKAEARRSDDEVWRPVRQALQERNVEIDLIPQVIEGTVDTVEFQYTWKNGKIHAYEPISFDLADAGNIREKARKWRGNLDAAVEGATEFVTYFVAGKPSDPQLMDAYHSAIEILRHAAGKPEIYEEDEIENLVSKIEVQVHSHHHR